MTSPAASGRHLSRFEKRPKMPHPTALFALSIMQCGIKPNAVSKASSNLSSEEYMQHVRTKLRGVSPSPPYSGFLVLVFLLCQYWITFILKTILSRLNF